MCGYGIVLMLGKSGCVEFDFDVEDVEEWCDLSFVVLMLVLVGYGCLSQ